MATLAGKIKKAERMFKIARKRAKDEGGGANKPDGAYRGIFKEFKITESGNGRLQCVFGVKIGEGEFKGEMERKYCGMDSEDNIVYLNKDLNRLGFDGFDSMEELEAIGEEIKGKGVRFKLVTKGEYQNCYFDKLLSDADYDDDPSDELDVPPKESNFSDGDRVSVEIEGKTYEGTVTEWGTDSCTVTFDDEDVQDIDNEELTLIDKMGPTADGGDGTLDVGDRVIADIEGTEYAGEIQEIDGTSALVKFDDGDEEDHELEDLVAEDAAGVPDEPTKVEKGMEVEVKIGRKTIEGTVIRVSSANGTMTIKDDDGATHKDIPISKILTVFEE